MRLYLSAALDRSMNINSKTLYKSPLIKFTMNTTLSNLKEVTVGLPNDLREYVRALSSITRLLEEKSTDDRYLGTTELLLWEIHSAFTDAYTNQLGGTF